MFAVSSVNVLPVGSIESQRMGDLPLEHVTPDRPFLYGQCRTFLCQIRTCMQAHHCQGLCQRVRLFVYKGSALGSSVRLTSDAFIACLRCFVARRGKPSLIMYDNGSNFTGANRELQELHHFL